MLVASKYEEIWAPEVRDFVYIADKAYTREQILGMEKLMCNALGFELTVPTPYSFLTRFVKVGRSDARSCILAILQARGFTHKPPIPCFFCGPSSPYL